MTEKKASKNERILEIYFFIISIMLVITLGILCHVLTHPLIKREYIHNNRSMTSNEVTQKSVITLIPTSKIIGHAKIKIPAVMNNSKPVYVLASMFITPGNGNIYVETHDTLIGTDTQQSIRKAIKYATKHEHLNENNYNFYVKIEGDASVLTGPSAGASFTVLAISALRKEIPSPKVMMTGTIMKNGSIGLSGKILEKAKAAKIAGAKIFLVPKGMAIMKEVLPVEDCDYYGNKKYCEIMETLKTINVSKESGIQVKGVSNIDEALKYFGI